MATFSIPADKYSQYYTAGGKPRTPQIAALIDIMQKAAAAAPPTVSKVELFSGQTGRSSGTTNHPLGRATDIQLYDATGAKIWNEPTNARGGSVAQTAASYPAYEQFAQTARQIQQSDYPSLTSAFRWGGYFVGGKSPLDLMHFDFSGDAIGSQAALWKNGLPSKAWPTMRSLGAKAATALNPADLPMANVGQTAKGKQMPLGMGKVDGVPVKGRISQGTAVKAWQSFLKSQGLLQDSPIDGKFGKKTDAATKAFQASVGFTGDDVDGLVGPKTHDAAARPLGALTDMHAPTGAPAAPAPAPIDVITAGITPKSLDPSAPWQTPPSALGFQPGAAATMAGANKLPALAPAFAAKASIYQPPPASQPVAQLSGRSNVAPTAQLSPAMAVSSGSNGQPYYSSNLAPTNRAVNTQPSAGSNPNSASNNSGWSSQPAASAPATNRTVNSQPAASSAATNRAVNTQGSSFTPTARNTGW